MMPVISTLNQALTAPTSTAKVVDLQRDIVDLASDAAQGLTTDHGVKISNTDDWSVLILHR